MNLKQVVTDFVTQALEPQYYLVAVSVRGNAQGAQKVTVLLDGDEGIGIDVCATLSRALGNYLEETDAVPTAYLLEVSSPGIDYPLATTRQYKKNIGRQLKVQKSDGNELTGTLTDVTDEAISLEIPVKEKGKKARVETTSLNLDTITKATVLISFK